MLPAPRAQLYDDVSVLDEELASVKALLGSCRSGCRGKRLLGGKIPLLAGDEAEDNKSLG